ncbi:hypothetical protein DFJ73DRAFT_807189 [Zopfochytrium polystomum]|nr:hypothetical protein DFJ73DRAFT_807189 [Zopfochytrium polystomum]
MMSRSTSSRSRRRRSASTHSSATRSRPSSPAAIPYSPLLLLLLVLSQLLLLFTITPRPAAAINPAELVVRENKYHPIYIPRLHRATVSYEASNMLDCKFLRWKAFLKRGNGFCDGLPPFDVKSNRTLVEECIHEYRKEARRCALAIKGGAKSYTFKFTFDASSEPCKTDCEATAEETHVHYKNHLPPSEAKELEDEEDQKKQDKKLSADHTHPLDSFKADSARMEAAAHSADAIEEAGGGAKKKGSAGGASKKVPREASIEWKPAFSKTYRKVDSVAHSKSDCAAIEKKLDTTTDPLGKVKAVGFCGGLPNANACRTEFQQAVQFCNDAFEDTSANAGPYPFHFTFLIDKGAGIFSPPTDDMKKDSAKAAAVRAPQSLWERVVSFFW